MTMYAAMSAESPVLLSATRFVMVLFFGVCGSAKARMPLMSAPRAGSRTTASNALDMRHTPVEVYPSSRSDGGSLVTLATPQATSCAGAPEILRLCAAKDKLLGRVTHAASSLRRYSQWPGAGTTG